MLSDLRGVIGVKSKTSRYESKFISEKTRRCSNHITLSKVFHIGYIKLKPSKQPVTLSFYICRQINIYLLCCFGELFFELDLHLI